MTEETGYDRYLVARVKERRAKQQAQDAADRATEWLSYDQAVVAVARELFGGGWDDETRTRSSRWLHLHDLVEERRGGSRVLVNAVRLREVLQKTSDPLASRLSTEEPNKEPEHAPQTLDGPGTNTAATRKPPIANAILTAYFRGIKDDAKGDPKKIPAQAKAHEALKVDFSDKQVSRSAVVQAHRHVFGPLRPGKR